MKVEQPSTRAIEEACWAGLVPGEDDTGIIEEALKAAYKVDAPKRSELREEEWGLLDGRRVSVAVEAHPIGEVVPMTYDLFAEFAARLGFSRLGGGS